MGESRNKQPALKNLFFIEEGNIAESGRLKKLNIDAIVNAADPTLMGSEQGVDQAIHRAIDTMKGDRTKGFFKKKICEELHTGLEEKQIRCRRGRAVLTQGYDLCTYVIHAVGAEYDGVVRVGWEKKTREEQDKKTRERQEKKVREIQEGQIRTENEPAVRTTCEAEGKEERSDKIRRTDMCSSSMVYTLECCYEHIVKLIMEHADIKRIGIPIIGAGHYRVPYRIAFQIAVASVYNALLERKEKDPEAFEMTAPERIYFFVYDQDPQTQQHNRQIGDEIMNDYGKIMDKENRIVFQTSKESHYRCLKEIQKYDRKRGYFSAARRVRLLVMWIRACFLPLMELKDVYGGADWSRRRVFVEKFAVGKALLSMTACILAYWCGRCPCPVMSVCPVAAVCPVMPVGPVMQMCQETPLCTEMSLCPSIFLCLIPIVSALIIYCMCDTITYLLALVLLADIQGPSANVTRSIILLLVNFVEICFGMACLYFLYCGHAVSMCEAMAFGVLGSLDQENMTLTEEIFRYANGVIRFFFITVIFGYLSGHMHQKKFRS